MAWASRQRIPQKKYLRHIPAGQVLPGDKVLVPVEGSGTQLGIVKSVKSATADVDTGAAFVRVKQSEITGKLVAVIPFFGIPLGWVGL